jgi:hypothetical protein
MMAGRGLYSLMCGITFIHFVKVEGRGWHEKENLYWM